MITIKTPEEIALMQTSGKIAAEILKKLAHEARPGATTHSLEVLAEEQIAEHAKQYGEVKAAFKNYEGFPAALCASVNEVIVHGVPGEYVLKEGDSIGLDFGVTYRGWYSDTAITIPVGKVDAETHRIIEVCKKALRLGIKKAKAGSTTGDIGETIQRFVEGQGYGIVRNLCGHGVGRDLHESPEVPNFGERHKGTELKAGMVIAIEPMITEGSPELVLEQNGNGYKTKDNSRTAHFEHTVAITKDGPVVLTSV